MRVLYVEDNRANLLLIERVAKMGGHEVIGRARGEDAIADFDEIQPDFILMDIQLEGKMTGLEAVQELRKQGRSLPIVALTAYAMKGDREKALEAGCDEYLPKPLPINKIVELFTKYKSVVAKAKISTPKKPPSAEPEATVEAKKTEEPEKPEEAKKTEETEKTIVTKEPEKAKKPEEPEKTVEAKEPEKAKKAEETEKTVAKVETKENKEEATEKS